MLQWLFVHGYVNAAPCSRAIGTTFASLTRHSYDHMKAKNSTTPAAKAWNIAEAKAILAPRASPVVRLSVPPSGPIRSETICKGGAAGFLGIVLRDHARVQNQPKHG